MFRNVIYEAWLNWVPYVSFGITGAVFLLFVFRAMGLQKERADELARLPLDDE